MEIIIIGLVLGCITTTIWAYRDRKEAQKLMESKPTNYEQMVRARMETSKPSYVVYFILFTTIGWVLLINGIVYYVENPKELLPSGVTCGRYEDEGDCVERHEDRE